MSTPRPPRFVPTLTEVVADATLSQPVAQLHANAVPSVLGPQVQEALVQRVLERLDQTLALRLREAIAQAAVEQSQVIATRMRAEIETVLTELVAQAVAGELASRHPGLGR